MNMNKKEKMRKISEKQINNLTRHHIVRLLTILEKDERIDDEIKNHIKKEFWFHNQNLKEKLWERNLMFLNETHHPWKPTTKIKEDMSKE